MASVSVLQQLFLCWTALLYSFGSAEGTTTQPLPGIISLLLREPFKKAAFTPEDLYTHKRSLDLQGGQVLGTGFSVFLTFHVAQLEDKP
jgi:hypothetical protein